MDASRLTVAFALVVVAIGLSRFVLGTVGRAGDVMAALFVPPDQSLGWPHGVQESDEPWAWRASSRSGGTQAPPPDEDASAGGANDLSWREPPSGRFVVPVAPVDPVHLGVRPH
jgi:hypothetical protein